MEKSESSSCPVLTGSDDSEPPGSTGLLSPPASCSTSNHSLCVADRVAAKPRVPSSRVRFSPRTLRFQRTFFPQATRAEWNDWRW